MVRPRLGVTGTHLGLSAEQRLQLLSLLVPLAPQQLHHGDCVGVDAQAAGLVALLVPTCRLFVHPPIDPKLRAFWKGNGLEVVLPAKDYLARDRDIVDQSDLLIACPRQNEEPTQKRGEGTWYTVRYARKQGKPVWVIYPDGRLIKETRP